MNLNLLVTLDVYPYIQGIDVLQEDIEEPIDDNEETTASESGTAK